MPDKIQILTEEEIYSRIKEMPGWSYADDKIKKEFKLNNFLDAIDFINQLAPVFESHDHHADIHIYYSKVLFELQRYDVGGKVTDMDFIIAGEIEKKYAERKQD